MLSSPNSTIPVPRAKRYRVLSACLFISFFSFLSACTFDKTPYSQSHMLSLHSRPDLSSPVVGRLRMNMQVEVVAKRKGWTQVTTRGISGWAPTPSFARKPLTLEKAVKQAQSASGVEKIEWLERIVALDGSKEQWTALGNAYAEAGLAEKAKYVRDILEGNTRVYLSMCSEHRQLVFAVYDRNEGLESLKAEQLDQLTTELADAAWYNLGNAIFSSPSVYINDLPGSSGGNMIQVGECWDPSFMATAPFDYDDGFDAVANEGKDKGKHRSIRDAIQKELSLVKFQFLEVLLVSKSPAIYQARFQGDDSNNNSVLGWSFQNAEFTTLWSNQVTSCKGDENLSCDASISDPSWFRFRFVPNIHIAITDWRWSSTENLGEDSQSSSRGGFWIALINEKGGIEPLEITTGGEGD